MASTCRPCAPPSTCAGRSLSAWPEGRSPSGAAPDGRKGGQDEALRPADAPTTVPRLPSATVGGVNHLPPQRHAKVSRDHQRWDDPASPLVSPAEHHAYGQRSRSNGRSGPEPRCSGDAMLKWALIFLVISIVAGALGFSG